MIQTIAADQSSLNGREILHVFDNSFQYVHDVRGESVRRFARQLTVEKKQKLCDERGAREIKRERKKERQIDRKKEKKKRKRKKERKRKRKKERKREREKERKIERDRQTGRRMKKEKE